METDPIAEARGFGSLVAGYCWKFGQYALLSLAAYLLGLYFSKKDKFQTLIDTFNRSLSQEEQLAGEIEQRQRQTRYLRRALLLAAAAMLALAGLGWLRRKGRLGPVSPFVLCALVAAALILLVCLAFLTLLGRYLQTLRRKLADSRSHRFDFVDEFFEVVGPELKEIILEAVGGGQDARLAELRAGVEKAAAANAKLRAEIEENSETLQTFAAVATQICDFEWCGACLQSQPRRFFPFLSAASTQASTVGESAGPDASASGPRSESQTGEERECLSSPRCLSRFLLLCEVLATKLKGELHSP